MKLLCSKSCLGARAGRAGEHYSKEDKTCSLVPPWNCLHTWDPCDILPTESVPSPLLAIAQHAADRVAYTAAIPASNGKGNVLVDR